MLEDHYTTPRFNVSIMHTNTASSPFYERGLDFSRSCRTPVVPLVVHDALMVHELLVSNDDTVLKSVQTISFLSIT